jgi:Ca2+-binding EF-hand superfamily protein
VATSDLVQRALDFDANHDGRVTKDELPERMVSILEQGDTNHDGALDREELSRLAERNAVQPQPPPGGRGRRGGGPPQ